jgi:hypothetical protein
MASSVRHFDVGEANRLVPVLAQTFGKVRGWLERARAVGEELEALGDQSPIGAPIDDPETPVGRLRAERDDLVGKMREAVSEIEEMGIEVKSVDGLVDFRASLAGRTVFLCWRFGEPEVRFWHELEAGFAGRHPIDRPDEFAPTYLS